jgi:hypothetical protein
MCIASFGLLRRRVQEPADIFKQGHALSSRIDFDPMPKIKADIRAGLCFE